MNPPSVFDNGLIHVSYVRQTSGRWDGPDLVTLWTGCGLALGDRYVGRDMVTCVACVIAKPPEFVT